MMNVNPQLTIPLLKPRFPQYVWTILKVILVALHPTDPPKIVTARLQLIKLISEPRFFLEHMMNIAQFSKSTVFRELTLPAFSSCFHHDVDHSG